MRRTSMLNHIRYECGVYPKYSCNVCGKLFALNASLRRHQLSCLNVPPEFKCELCAKMFRHRDKLKYHKALRHNIQDLSFPCLKQCGRIYKSRKAMLNHIRDECGIIPKYACGICHKLFSLRGNMKKHMIKCGQHIKHYDCPNLCGRSYKAQQTLKRHIRDECFIIPKYSCSICNKLFSQKGTMVRHMLSCSNTPPGFHCNVCTACFRRKDRLIRHKTYVHSIQLLFPELLNVLINKWMCSNQCGKMYRHKGGLNRHLKMEYGVVPMFLCELCLKPFKCKCHFESHLSVCANVDPQYSCDLCKKLF
ncbi:zinc finger protein 569-like [Daktulosphaira vitifoliae]|uniref:zinc finger protein 569-like n=1 Tax=Daktulosphaira vitifoliae TaxID=58002 RepID=UPI0021AA3603|nr:zinc finger protein 569-like [Daktulosphaira vitifoliae]